MLLTETQCKIISVQHLISICYRHSNTSSCIAVQDQRSAVAIFLTCMSVRVCRPKLFKNLCLSLVSGVPPLHFLGLHPCSSVDNMPDCGACVRSRDRTIENAVVDRRSRSDRPRHRAHTRWTAPPSLTSQLTCGVLGPRECSVHTASESARRTRNRHEDRPRHAVCNNGPHLRYESVS